jgi:hypothetical protein
VRVAGVGAKPGYNSLGAFRVLECVGLAPILGRYLRWKEEPNLPDSLPAVEIAPARVSPSIGGQVLREAWFFAEACPKNLALTPSASSQVKKQARCITMWCVERIEDIPGYRLEASSALLKEEKDCHIAFPLPRN